MRLIAEGLSCVRGERNLFHALSLDLPPGSATRLIGLNGVGKTSLLRILAGLLSPSAGAVGIAQSGDVPHTERITFVGVRGGLKNALTVGEHLRFWSAMAGAADAGADRLWGLSDLRDAPVGWLSSGQRRRLELARLTCERRPIWLLDEPLNALDDAAAALLHGAVEGLRAAGGLVVAASHQPLPWPDLATVAVGDFAPTVAR